MGRVALPAHHNTPPSGRTESEAGVGARDMKVFIREAFLYTAVSALGFLIDITILWILVRYLSWGYLCAATTSFVVGLLVGYVLSVNLVFKYRRLKNQRIEFASFAAIGVVGVVINVAAMSIGVKFLGLHYLLAKCGSAGFTFLLNFLARRQFLFVQRRPA
jgi:putative flippase GtrA